MVRISACVIAKNEAPTISSCLQSVSGFVNETVVVDTGSTDDTPKIAKECGARLFYYQWRDDFAAARNYALQKAKGDWILFLDADEYITADTIANVRPLLEQLHPHATIESVICLMENTDGPDGALKGCNPTVRIFRNSPAIRYAGRVHECIYKNAKPTRAFKDTERRIVIRHTGYAKGVTGAKLLRNTRMLEEDVNRGVVYPLTYLYLSDGYRKLRQYEKAVRFARLAMEHECDSPMIYKPHVALMAGMAQLGIYSAAEVEAVCSQALQRFPRHPEIILQQGYCAMAVGHYQKALQWFLKAVTANAQYEDLSLENEFPGQIATVLFNIAQLYDWMNNPVQALDYYVEALRHNKYSQEAFQGLISLIRQQEPAAVVYFLNSIYDCADPADLEFLVRRLSCLKIRKALDFYQNILAEQFGQREYGGMVVLCNGLYEQAFQYFASLFRDKGDSGAELLAVASLILGDAPGWVASLGPNLKAFYRRIIATYFTPDAEGIPGDYLSEYLGLLADLVHLCDPRQLERYLRVGRGFGASGAVRVGDELVKQGLFREAAEVLSVQMAAASPGTERATLYCKVGFCRYRLRDYAAAADYFAKSLESGYRGPDLFEFIEWSQRQCSVNEVREKLEALQRSFENPVKPAAAQPKIIIGITVRQKPAILREYLASLMNLDLQGFHIEFYFIDDNTEPDSKQLLRQWAGSDERVTVQEIEPEGVYLCSEETHQWNSQAMARVGRLKDQLLDYARQKKCHLFLVDSDLVLHPRTLQQLWRAEREIIAEIFWTRWKPGESPLPQVWVKGQYTLFHYIPGERLTQAEIKDRVHHFVKMLREPGVYEVGGLGGVHIDQKCRA